MFNRRIQFQKKDIVKNPMKYVFKLMPSQSLIERRKPGNNSLSLNSYLQTQEENLHRGY